MLTKNFSKGEMQCPCCHKCDMNATFMDKLQDVRDSVGKPLTVTSGYRCKKRNEAVKGAKNSMHTYGQAVDLACDDMFLRYEIVKAAIKVGFNGIEISPKHVHLDDRQSTARLMWTDFKIVV